MKDVSASANCVRCGAPIERWRERFTPIRSGIPVRTATGNFAIRTYGHGACECGEGLFEIRLEDGDLSS